MKLTTLSFLSLATALSAGTPATTTPPTAAAPCHDDLVPQGVMFAHTHGAGQWMLGYRYSWSHFDGLLRGSDSISEHDVFKTIARAGTPYTAAMQSMDMHMHMLDLMWAPNDWATFMVMPQFMEMDMTMIHGGGHHDEHAEHGHSEHGHAEKSGTHSHSTSGWGDTRVMGMFSLWKGSHNQQAILNLGMSIPSGSVDEKVGSNFTHYGMQLGSGTWDIMPGLTYTGHTDRFGWGAQALATVRLEEENSSGYQLGNAVTTTAWLSARLTDWASLSARVAYTHEDAIDGHYHGSHNHAAPVDLQGNYGGHSLDVGLGVNFYLQGALKGHRIGIEALTPVYQDVNGIQLDRELTLAVGWQMSF